MSYRRLPIFDNTITVSADDARQDRIRVSYGNWLFHDIAGEALYAADVIAEEEHPIPGNRNAATRRIFNNPRPFDQGSTSIQFTKLRINDEDGPLHGLPLARGTIDFHCEPGGESLPFPGADADRLRDERADYWRRRLAAEDAGQEFDEAEPINPEHFRPTRYRIDAQLTLNPTRMINHQDLQRVVRHRNEPGFIYPDIQLMTSKRGISDGRFGGEFTLANHDNVIVGVRNHVMSRPPHYRYMRDNYFQAWFDFIDGRIRRNLGTPLTEEGQLRHEPRFSLSYAENYHEFRCDNPLQAIEDLRPYIRTLSQHVRNLRIRDWSQADYLEGNEIGYRVDLAQGLKLVIYSKTNKRIRIEARTDLSERCKDRNFPHTRHTADSLAAISDLIDATATDAANKVNEALDIIRPGLAGEGSELPDQSPPYELVREIMRAVSDEYRDLADNADNRRSIASAQQLLLALIIIRNGCAPPPQQRLQQAAARLQRRGILLPPNSGHVRVLAPKFQNARRILLAELHGGGNDADNE
ncbi:MAG: hypothetical protein OIF56_11800 [Cohaesibacter sp.]|nr:hypothetical protein [Cohaesibacter sp.]